jgi:hypothetical protein
MAKSRLIRTGMNLTVKVITGAFLILAPQGIHGAHPQDNFPGHPALTTIQISGAVIDVATGNPVENARITLLDPVSRAVICGEIYTDGNGSYEGSVEFEPTGSGKKVPESPLSYAIIQSYPNPLSAAASDHLTIRYTVPGNRSETPAVLVYDILGSRIGAEDYLSAGVYFYRLRFENGHHTGSGKIVLTSGGVLRISLIQAFQEPGEGPVRKGVLDGMEDNPVEVLFVIEKSGYIHMERKKELVQGINNVNNFSMVEEGEKSSATIDSTGGVIPVANSLGDSIILTIPPYALWEPTAITVTSVDTPPGNPIARNIFPGVSLTPAGLKLLQPATLKVVLATTAADTGSAMLFSIRQSDFVLPVGGQEVTDSTLSGEIYHFSEFAGGEPTPDEAGPQADGAGGMGPSDPYGWQDTYDCVDALLWWAEFYSRNGMTEEGQKCFDDAKETAENDATDFLDLPVPDDPCGDYLTALFRFAELVNMVVGGDLNARIGERVIEIVNRCALRGEIEYDHDVTCTDADRNTHTRIVGRIPFYVNTQVEPIAAISGGGTAVVTITGAQEECYLSATGVHRVNSISGELKADQQGIYWLEMTLDETWYESTTVYVTCPDPDNNSQGPMPSFSAPTLVRFLVQDGWKYTLPAIDCDGSYNWILHIIHQP